MSQTALSIVAADDDEMSLELMIHSLKGAGCNTVGFGQGEQLLNYVRAHASETDVVILDKIMPNLSGVDILKRMKADPNLKNIPVIIQTGDVGLQQMRESIDAGAYYYLSKPYDPSAMISLVKAAARDCLQRKRLHHKLDSGEFAINLLHQGVFKVRTPDDCQSITALISSVAEQKKEVALVLSELIINGIEHGNLEIGYAKKGELLESGQLDNEITRLLTVPENRKKRVTVSYARLRGEVKVRVRDEGEGFEWKRYITIDPGRFVDLNGRGIAYANIVGIPITYIGNGNTVEFSFAAEKI